MCGQTVHVCHEQGVSCTMYTVMATEITLPITVQVYLHTEYHDLKGYFGYLVLDKEVTCV